MKELKIYDVRKSGGLKQVLAIVTTCPITLQKTIEAISPLQFCKFHRLSCDPFLHFEQKKFIDYLLSLATTIKVTEYRNEMTNKLKKFNSPMLTGDFYSFLQGIKASGGSLKKVFLDILKN